MVSDAEILIKQGHIKEEPVEETYIPKDKEALTSELSSNQIVFKEHLADKLSSKIELKKSTGGSGKIIINFSSDVDFNRIIEILNK